MSVADPGLLFVVSNDFGELSIALGFVNGYPFRTRLLLPDRVFAANRDGLPVPADRWASVDDVIARAGADDPDVVVLCSAYLYAFNGLVALEEVERLVETLRTDGRRLVTTDPFLGLLSRPEGVFRPGHPRSAWLTEHFGRLARVLRDVPHLYFVDVPVAGLQTLSFFNPHVVVDRPTIETWARERIGWMDLHPPRRRWVFVLSGEDWARQTARHGGVLFEALLVAKLGETARAGRQAVLIAPDAALDRIRSRTGSIEGVALVPFTSHRVFTTLVLDAEHVFYWNVVSNSIPLRIVNHLPVFFFDAGHVVHAIPALGDLGLTLYWGGVEPPSVAIEERLDAARLADMAQAQDRALEPTRERWRRSPPPDALVRALVADRSAAVDSLDVMWLDAGTYPFCALLEEHYAPIRAELERAIQSRLWVPWKERPYTPTSAIPGAIGEGDEPRWRLFGLYLKGRAIERHCRLCPDTARVLARIPRVTKAAFACLEAGAIIEPHMGHNPHNDRTHLALVIPPGDCGMRVGGESRGWEPGKATIFHDNQVHEAWNRTASHRYILIVDVDNRSADDPSAAAALEADAF